MTIRRAPERPARSVRMTDAEWRLIEAVAAAAEKHPSTWLREASVNAARREIAEGRAS